MGSPSVGSTCRASQHLVEEFGDALTCGATILVHQCNMISTDARGIAQFIFRQFPTADCYKDDATRRRREAAGGLGKMELVDVRPTLRRDDACSPRFICNLFGQNFPGKGGGKGRRHGSIHETKEQRLSWFRSGLDHLRSVMQDMAKQDISALPVKRGSPGGASLRAGPYTRAGGGSSEALPPAIARPSPGAVWHGKTIAFPFLIGCGLAGGHWPDYRAAIEAFAQQVHSEFGAVVQLIALPKKCRICKGTFNEQQGKGTGKRSEEWCCHLCRQKQ